MSLDAQPASPEPFTPQGRLGRPALAAAIAASYLVRLLLGLLASYPALANVSASGILDFDSGDGKLFEAGGLYLLEWLVRERGALVALFLPTALLLVLGSLVLVLPEWLLVRALGGEPRNGDAAALASGASIAPNRGNGSAPQRALGRLVALALGSWAARGLLALATAALATTASSFFVSARDERLQVIAAGGVVLLGLLAWACLGVLHDMAKIEVALGGAPLLPALGRALGTSRRHALQLAARYALWALATGLVLAAGTVAAASFDVTVGGSFAALAAIVVHQSTVLAQIGLHAAWLASALAARRHAPTQRGRGRAHADAFL